MTQELELLGDQQFELLTKFRHRCKSLLNAFKENPCLDIQSVGLEELNAQLNYIRQEKAYLLPFYESYRLPVLSYIYYKKQDYSESIRFMEAAIENEIRLSKHIPLLIFRLQEFRLNLIKVARLIQNEEIINQQTKLLQKFMGNAADAFHSEIDTYFFEETKIMILSRLA
ncbi:MAG: hypothetical protein U0V04_03285 [Spirosomataceae bacterium]|jgi:endonuclease III-like uncharacterized protein